MTDTDPTCCELACYDPGCCCDGCDAADDADDAAPLDECPICVGIGGHTWASSTPVLTHCRHGLDLRLNPRCYLCEPAATPAPLDVDALYRALLAVENHGAPIVATDYLAIAAAYTAEVK